MIKQVGKQISAGCSAAGRLRAFSTSAKPFSVTEHPAVPVHEGTSCGSPQLDQAPTGTQHRAQRTAILGMPAHLSVDMGHFLPHSSSPYSCQAKSCFRTCVLTFPSPWKALHTDSHAVLLSLPSSHFIKDDFPGCSIKNCINHPYPSPRAHPLLYFFLYLPPPATWCVCLLTIFHPPHPAALKWQLHDSRNFVHSDQHYVPSV